MRSKPILFAIVSVVFLLTVALVCGFFMPGAWKAEARATIQAPPAAIHPWLADVERWPQWFPWTTAKDPDIRYAFPGKRSGVGAVIEWHSDRVGHGTLTITSADPARGVAYDLVFQDSARPSRGEIVLVPDGAGTAVTWSDGGELGANPVARLFRAPIERMLSQEFTVSLARLKSLVESPPAALPEGARAEAGND